MNFCVMVVAPWVAGFVVGVGCGSLAWGVGSRHGVWSMGVAVWVAGMCGCGSVGKKKWVWPCGLPVCLLGKRGKKN